jgi:F0F1-type ATP synthase delta subunit
VLLTQYIKERFGEKTTVYAGYFNLLSIALENHDMETVKMILENIMAIYRDDPSFTKSLEKRPILFQNGL